MYIRTAAFLSIVLFFLVVSTPAWAGTCTTDGTSCSVPVSPADTTAIFDFTVSGNGVLTLQFDTVLTSFDLTVTLNNTIDALSPSEFPAGTVCVKYAGNGPSGTDACVQYDVSGDATSGGPNMVPVKNVDYRGLITVTLSYNSNQTIRVPAFGHAPGDNATATYTENILTFYSTAGPAIIDPTMGGKVPNISSFAAFDEPFTTTSPLCGTLSLSPTVVGNGEKPQVEVLLQVAATCGNGGTRDKTAALSVSTVNSNGYITFPALKNVEGNKFHWDNRNSVNEYDISLDGLADGAYTVSVFSSVLPPPASINFCVSGGAVVTCGP